ncbi:MAG: Fic family protein [Myxococcales bacterium]|nr:Fic family protein [Myxococcales bacterium]
MLRITEKDSFASRKREVEAVLVAWKESVTKVPTVVEREFRSKLMISIIYHDSALEGEVLSHSEIQAATDTSIISDSSLIPAYESITNFHGALTVALQLAAEEKKVPIRLELIRQLYGILNPAAKETKFAYRSDNPLHRLYYHSISAPDDVPAKMKVLDTWLKSDEFGRLEPIVKASHVHWRLMRVFPWLVQSGRLSRILSLLILEQEGCPLAVVHSVDRQAYYEALKDDSPKALTEIYMEAVETTASSSLRVYEEAAAF